MTPELLELHLTYTCPQDCVFCSEAHRMDRFRPYPVTWGRIARVLREHAANGGTAVHFTGGEPTLHHRLADALAMARKLRMHTSLGTNGSVLARKGDRILALAHEIMLSLHGPVAEVHDAMTRTPGSFARALEAAARIPSLQVNIVVTRQNLDHVAGTVRLADSLGASLIIVSNLSPEGRALDDYARLAAPLDRLEAAVPAIVAATSSTLRFFGVPLCKLGEHQALSNDLHWDPRVTVEWVQRKDRVVMESMVSTRPDRKRTKPAMCSDCDRRALCGGIFEGAHLQVGGGPQAVPPPRRHGPAGRSAAYSRDVRSDGRLEEGGGLPCEEVPHEAR